METRIDSGVGVLSHKEALELDHDYLKSARKVRLQYVSDSIEGVRRVRKGKRVVYYFRGRPVRNEDDLERIRKLAIPPSWTRVWICPFANGHIQATGYDLKNRKQYRYHTSWSAVRNETKFHRLHEFGKSLPALRRRIEDDLRQKGLTQTKVLATIVSLMERTYIRVGNDDYNRLYGSHGITTLHDNHVRVNGSELRFSFTGKKGKTQTVTLRNLRLAKMVRQCRDIPGKTLFQYFDDEGNRHPVDSGMVNDYIREASQGDFTAKDFRTWAGSLNLLRSLCTLGNATAEAECRKNIIQALDEVSEKLGNTRAVCRKFYVHPGIIELYEKNALSRYLKELDMEEPDILPGLTSDEKVLMRVLKTLH